MSQYLIKSDLGMSNIGSNSHKDKQASFWKKNAKTVPGNIRPVYGAQHPPRVQNPHETTEHETPKRQRNHPPQRDSFQDFQENTDDAWDDGDDDLLMMANIKLNLQDVHSTAIQVINSHSQQRAAARMKDLENDVQSEVSRQRVISSSRPDSSNCTNSSGPSTPAHERQSGPGVGVRLLHHSQTRVTPRQSSHLPPPGRGEASKCDKLASMFNSDDMDLDDLRKVCWSGIPRKYRPIAWKTLSGYIPPNVDRRELTLKRKRQEYYNFIDQYYETRHHDIHSETFRQILKDVPRMSSLISIFEQKIVQEIHIDIPRMSPLISLFNQQIVQEIFERILYIWAIRHPASGYVQGINDLVTPFFVVFLSEFVKEEASIENCDVTSLPSETLRTIEADSFWCFSKLLDSIQDNYTFAQPGIQLKVNALKDIISRVDNDLHKHLTAHNVEYLQFSFRWMNNLLMREIPLRCTIRLWDSYLSESSDFASLHLYMCAAFLLKFADDMKREKDFQGLMIMLQNLPTHSWGNEEINLLLAEAYKLKYMFADAPKHFNQKK